MSCRSVGEWESCSRFGYLAKAVEKSLISARASMAASTPWVDVISALISAANCLATLQEVGFCWILAASIK